MDYSKAFKRIRGFKGLSQKDLANILNVDPSLISLIESGSRKPSKKILVKINEELDIPKELLELLAKPIIHIKNFSKSETELLLQNLLDLLDN